jgi:hypothetical protein
VNKTHLEHVVAGLVIQAIYAFLGAGVGLYFGYGYQLLLIGAFVGAVAVQHSFFFREHSQWEGARGGATKFKGYEAGIAFFKGQWKLDAYLDFLLPWAAAWGVVVALFFIDKAGYLK